MHPRRAGSSYLLSGLVKCKTCKRALSSQYSKSGQFPYYVCQSLMKRGKEACKTPRLAARRFEEMVVSTIRSNILTDSDIHALVKVVDEQMDGVAGEHRKRLETIQSELADVRRRLDRLYDLVETTDRRSTTSGPASATTGSGRSVLRRRRARRGRPWGSAGRSWTRWRPSPPMPRTCAGF